MAELALVSIAKSSLQLFTSLATDEFLLLWHSTEELEKLKEAIEAIAFLLQDADMMQSKELSVTNCLDRLRNVMYDAEDLFDGLAAMVLHKRTMDGNAFSKEVPLFFSESNQLAVVYKVAHKVKSVRESLDRVKEDMLLQGFIRQPSDTHVTQSFMRVDRNKTHSFVREEDVVGRDEDKAHVINMLLPGGKGETSCDGSFSVVAIIGFGGLGKTTLAQYVYNDVRVKEDFDEHLWACINDLSNLEQVLMKILASKVEKNQLQLSLQMLQEKLRGILGGKKFLIVLDDVWDESSGNWLALEQILRCGSSGSKVLVTTRSSKVADCLDALKAHRIDLDKLSDESAWSLFVKKAFHMGELSEHPELVSLGKRIVRRCGNAPLAIISVGSLLRSKEKEEKIWSDFLDIRLKGVLSGSDDITKVLMVSYNDLPPNLKLCFAYCSLFPKDHIFDKDELVRLWLAQGFIKPSVDTEQNMEEVGEAYFFYLVERCFFQQVEQHEWSFPYSHWAKMHDLLHDVAIHVSETESVLLDKVSFNKGKSHNRRHISISLDASFDYCSVVSDSRMALRTLLFHVEYRFYGANLNKTSSMDLLVPSCRMLRTLCLGYMKVENISDSIGELIHLRYLNLSGNLLKYLPNSICKLHHLIILMLEDCGLLEKLPPKIENLVSLRQLYIEGCVGLGSLPSGLIALTSLVNLDRIIVDRDIGGLRFLNQLDNLRGSLRVELPQEGWSNAIKDAKNSNMSRKDKLGRMAIKWKQINSTNARAILEELQPHENLESLEIDNYGGEILSSWLCTLKNLKKLNLYGCEHVEYIEDERKGDFCFPFLKTLSFSGMKNLKGWWRQEIVEGMQQPCAAKVSEVVIHDCQLITGRMPLMEVVEILDLSGVDVVLVKELLFVNPDCSPPFDNNNKLTKLKLSKIESLTCLQEGWIGHLTALKCLRIRDCSDLRWVSRRGLSRLTALTELKLKSGEIGGDEDEDGGDVKMGKESDMPWKSLQRLVDLRVEVGDKHLLEGLECLTLLVRLDVTCLKIEEEDGVALQLKGLRNLSELNIGFDGKTCDLHKAGIQYLHSLRYLKITHCKELYLSWKMLLINKKLYALELENVERVIDVDDDMMMEQQGILSALNIKGGGGKWVDNIPWKFLSSLQSLCINGLKEMEKIPDGVQHLTSLDTLMIVGCEKLRSLPNWISKLTSLTRLRIEECSEELEKRCERERGEDWHLISHVPNRDIGKRSIEDPSKPSDGTINEEEGSGKMGCYSSLTLSRFKHKFH